MKRIHLLLKDRVRTPPLFACYSIAIDKWSLLLTSAITVPMQRCDGNH